MNTSAKIPHMHKALVYDKPGILSVKLVDVETPEPGVGEVLVRLTHSGVCHSDYGIMTTAWSWLPRPCLLTQVGGHEDVGVVARLGAGVREGTVRLGDRVGIKWVSNICRHCPACLAGADGCCLNIKISGYYTPGTFQQYALAPADYVTHIPDSIPSELAAPLLCGSVTSYAALNKARAQPGDWVVILGAGGGVGHLACQIGSRGMGFRIIGIDSEEKESMVRDCGAEEFLSLQAFSRNADGDAALAKAVKCITGGLGACAVLFCNGSDSAYAQAITFLRFNGTVVVVGCQEGDTRPIASATPNNLLFTQLNIVGSAVGNQLEAHQTFDLTARGIIRVRAQVEKMDGLMSVFERMHSGKLLGKTVIDLQ